MKTISLKKKLFILTGSLMLAIVLIITFVLWPAVRTINSLGKNIEETEQYLEDQYLKSQRMQRSLRELDAIEMQVKNFEGLTIPPDTDLELITGLEALALAHNIEQNIDIQYVEDKKRTIDGYYEVSFLNHGTYKDHLEYLRTLEELPYYVHIQNITLERRGSSNSDKALATLRFTAKIYASAT